MKQIVTKKKIAVAISGGVDSSVAAALLKKQGHDLIAIFMHFWHEQSKFEDLYHQVGNKCCSLQAEEKARQVARILDIPFYVFHFEKEFKQYVVDYFIEEYDKGFTPNPCIACNKNIKFKFLFNKNKSLGYDNLATGHYIINKSGSLFRAKDKAKDQTYFLYNLKKEDLKNLYFPLGDIQKYKTRQLAKKLKLPTSEIKDSQGICFVLQKNVNDFLKKHLKKVEKGDIKNIKGEIIGQHEGLQYYTIGQRKGIEIAAEKPYYVVDLDYQNNALIVSDNEQDSALYSNELDFDHANWLVNYKNIPQKILAQIRYRQQPQKAIISKINNNKYHLVFNEGQRAVMPGQSVVIYQNNKLLGGGIIRKRY